MTSLGERRILGIDYGVWAIKEKIISWIFFTLRKGLGWSQTLFVFLTLLCLHFLCGRIIGMHHHAWFMRCLVYARLLPTSHSHSSIMWKFNFIVGGSL